MFKSIKLLFKSIKLFFAKRRFEKEIERLTSLGRVTKSQYDDIDDNTRICNIAYADGSHSAIIYDTNDFEIYSIMHVSANYNDNLQIV